MTKAPKTKQPTPEQAKAPNDEAVEATAVKDDEKAALKVTPDRPSVEEASAIIGVDGVIDLLDQAHALMMATPDAMRLHPDLANVLHTYAAEKSAIMERRERVKARLSRSA